MILYLQGRERGVRKYDFAYKFFRRGGEVQRMVGNKGGLVFKDRSSGTLKRKASHPVS